MKSLKLAHYWLLTILAFSFIQMKGQIIGVEIKTKKDGGGNGGSKCYICYAPQEQELIIELKPTHFPFKIRNVKLTDYSDSGLEIDFGTAGPYFNPKILVPTGAEIPNQIVYSNSGFLNQNGNILLRMKYEAKLCASRDYFDKSGLFKVKTTVFYERLDQSGNLLQLKSYNTSYKSDIQRNCDSSIPYKFSLNLLKPGKVLEDRIHAININTYSNPSLNSLKIEFRNHLMKGSTIVLYNSSGEIIYTRKLELRDIKNGNIEIDLSQKMKGLYIVKLIGPNLVLTKKILKE